MILGALLGVIAGGGDVVATLTKEVGPLALFIIPVLSLGIASTNAMNLYCGALSAITVIQTIFLHGKPRMSGAQVRLLFCLAFLFLSLSAQKQTLWRNTQTLFFYCFTSWYHGLRSTLLISI